MAATYRDTPRAVTPFEYLASLQSAGATLGDRVLATFAAAPAGAGLGSSTPDAAPREPDDDIAIIDRELARLFAVRELFLAWVQELRAQEGRGSSGLPAQFLRAWSESTGRVIQLLRARRDLSSRAGGDALLDAVYEDLERRLPDPGTDLSGVAGGPADADRDAVDEPREE